MGIDGFSMAKGFETLDSMIGTHPTRSDASKGKIFLGNVHNHIVEGYAPRDRLIEHSTSFSMIFTEVIKAEGSLVIVDVADGLLNVVVGFNRKYRTKNLLLHDQHIFSGVNN